MAVSITQTANPAGVNSSGNVATYTDVAIGDAHPDRIVVVCVGTELASASINSCTLGGSAMTGGTQGNQGNVYARTFYLAYPTGTTATIAVTYGANPDGTQNHIAVYNVYDGAYSATGAHQSTDMDASAPLTTGSTTITTGGGMIAVAAGAVDGTAKTWANLTENIDDDAGAFRFTTAFSTTAGTATRTCTGGNNGEDGALSYLIFTNKVNALATDLISYYPFEGNSQDSVASNDGSDSSITYGTNYGKISQGASFNGTTSIIYTPLLSTVLDNFSMTCWIYLNDLTQTAVIFHNGNSGANGYGLFMSNGSGTDGDKLCALYGGVAYLNSGTSFASTGVWYHIAIVRDAGTLQFYLNGSATGTTFTDNPNTPTTNSNFGGAQFNGYIDEAGFWNRAISATEISYLYNGGAGQTYPLSSPSYSPSSSVSPSNSPSRSPSSSVSPSVSPSTSPSRSPSSSISPSRSPSTSISPSLSPSSSRSPSSSISPSRSPSHSVSPSRSPSHSVSPSRSPSTSISPSRSPSTSISPSRSPSTSISPSRSPSTSVSPSRSPSASVSPSIAPVGFKTEWTVAGDATARTITLPLYNSGTFNCTVDWGDGTADSTITSYDDADRIHTYASDGTYQVEIFGSCPAWSFNDGGDKLKITKIVDWGNVQGFDGFSYLTGGFYGCTNLTSLGTGKILALSGLTNLLHTFRGCNITSIPAGLFDNCINLASNGVRSTFQYCSKLTSIPTDLFRYNTLVSTYGFYATFTGCSNLISIPTDLFRYNTAVSTYGFAYTFNGCFNLISIPTDLFRYNTACTGFQYTFYACTKLQLNRWIFYAPGEESTRFLNQSVDFTQCFQRTSFTGTQGIAPELWNCSYGTGTPTTTSCFAGAGNSTTSIYNYVCIPADWGGTAYDATACAALVIQSPSESPSSSESPSLSPSSSESPSVSPSVSPSLSPSSSESPSESPSLSPSSSISPSLSPSSSESPSLSPSSSVSPSESPSESPSLSPSSSISPSESPSESPSLSPSSSISPSESPSESPSLSPSSSVSPSLSPSSSVSPSEISSESPSLSPSSSISPSLSPSSSISPSSSESPSLSPSSSISPSVSPSTSPSESPSTSPSESPSLSPSASASPSTPPTLEIKINIGDVWKDVVSMQINVGDEWKSIDDIKINHDGSWREVL